MLSPIGHILLITGAAQMLLSDEQISIYERQAI